MSIKRLFICISITLLLTIPLYSADTISVDATNYSRLLYVPVNSNNLVSINVLNNGTNACTRIVIIAPKTGSIDFTGDIAPPAGWAVEETTTIQGDSAIIYRATGGGIIGGGDEDFQPDGNASDLPGIETWTIVAYFTSSAVDTKYLQILNHSSADIAFDIRGFSSFTDANKRSPVGGCTVTLTDSLSGLQKTDTLGYALIIFLDEEISTAPVADFGYTINDDSRYITLSRDKAAVNDYSNGSNKIDGQSVDAVLKQIINVDSMNIVQSQVYRTETITVSVKLVNAEQNPVTLLTTQYTLMLARPGTSDTIYSQSLTDVSSSDGVYTFYFFTDVDTPTGDYILYIRANSFKSEPGGNKVAEGPQNDTLTLGWDTVTILPAYIIPVDITLSDSNTGADSVIKTNFVKVTMRLLYPDSTPVPVLNLDTLTVYLQNVQNPGDSTIHTFDPQQPTGMDTQINNDTYVLFIITWLDTKTSYWRILIETGAIADTYPGLPLNNTNTGPLTQTFSSDSVYVYVPIIIFDSGFITLDTGITGDVYAYFEARYDTNGLGTPGGTDINVRVLDTAYIYLVPITPVPDTPDYKIVSTNNYLETGTNSDTFIIVFNTTRFDSPGYFILVFPANLISDSYDGTLYLTDTSSDSTHLSGWYIADIYFDSESVEKGDTVWVGVALRFVDGTYLGVIDTAILIMRHLGGAGETTVIFSYGDTSIGPGDTLIRFAFATSISDTSGYYALIIETFSITDSRPYFPYSGDTSLISSWVNFSDSVLLDTASIEIDTVYVEDSPIQRTDTIYVRVRAFYPTGDTVTNLSQITIQLIKNGGEDTYTYIVYNPTIIATDSTFRLPLYTRYDTEATSYDIQIETNSLIDPYGNTNDVDSFPVNPPFDMVQIDTAKIVVSQLSTSISYLAPADSNQIILDFKLTYIYETGQIVTNQENTDTTDTILIIKPINPDDTTSAIDTTPVTIYYTGSNGMWRAIYRVKDTDTQGVYTFLIKTDSIADNALNTGPITDTFITIFYQSSNQITLTILTPVDNEWVPLDYPIWFLCSVTDYGTQTIIPNGESATVTGNGSIIPYDTYHTIRYTGDSVTGIGQCSGVVILSSSSYTEGVISVSVRITDEGGISGVDTVTLNVDITRPRIIITGLSGVVAAGQIVTMSIYASDTLSGIANLSPVSVKIDGINAATLNYNSISDTYGTVDSAIVNVPSGVSGDPYITVQIADKAGNIGWDTKYHSNTPDSSFIIIGSDGDTVFKNGDSVYIRYYGYGPGLYVVIDTTTFVNLDTTKSDTIQLSDTGGLGDTRPSDAVYCYEHTISNLNQASDSPYIQIKVLVYNGGSLIDSQIAIVQFDSTPPDITGYTILDADTIYRDGETISIFISYGSDSSPLTVSIEQATIDSLYPGDSVINKGTNGCTIYYKISQNNANPDAETYYLIILLRDAAFNSDSIIIFVALDNTPPDTPTLTVLQANYRNGETVIISVTNTGALARIEGDFSNLDSMFSETMDTYQAVNNGGTITYYISLANSRPNGVYQVNITVYDTAGNSVSQKTFVELKNRVCIVVSTPPTPDPSADSFLIVFMVYDYSYPIDTILYYIDAYPSTAYGIDTIVPVLPADTITFGTSIVNVLSLSQGNHTLYALAVDTAGETSNVVTQSFTVSQSGGTMTIISLTPDPAPDSITVIVSITDNDFPIDTIYYYLDAYPGTAVIFDTWVVSGVTTYGTAQIIVRTLLQGNHTLYVAGVDTLGNWSNVASRNFTVFQTGGTITLLLKNPDPATDTLLIVVKIEDYSFPVDTIQYTIDAYPGQDTGFDSKAVFGSITLGTTVVRTSGLSNENHSLFIISNDTYGNFSNLLIVNFQVARAQVIVVINSPSNNSILNYTNINIKGYAQDVAVNLSSMNVNVINSFVNMNSSASPLDGSWNEMVEPFDFYVGIDSGIRDGGNTITLTVTDIAGNTGSASVYIIVDTLPPSFGSVTLSPETVSYQYQNQVFSDKVQLDIIVNDSNAIEILFSSELVAGQVYGGNPGETITILADLKPGTNTLTCIARDEAGNSTTLSINIYYLKPEASGYLGPSGGTLYAQDSTYISAPVGAFTDQTLVTITIPDISSIPPVSDNTQRTIKVTRKFTPSNIQLQRPVTIAIPYTHNDLIDQYGNQVAEADLKIYYYNGYEWIEEVSSVNVINNIITASVNHLGLFTLMGAGSTAVRVYISNNPVTPENGTTFSFDNPATITAIHLYIHTLSGKLAFEYHQNSGNNITWFADNNAGRFVGSGLYIYRLEIVRGTSTQIITKPIAVIKQ
ncbi:MAG: hypothetical protein AB1765_09310 [Candidatus Hydrogenedentota bacterium]